MVAMLLSQQYIRTLKMPTENPTPTLEHFKIKGQTLLTDNGCKYYYNKIRNPKPPQRYHS